MRYKLESKQTIITEYHQKLLAEALENLCVEDDDIDPYEILVEVDFLCTEYTGESLPDDVLVVSNF